MARNLVSASSQYLEYPSAIVAAAPLSVSVWFYPAATNVSYNLFNVGDPTGNFYFNVYLCPTGTPTVGAAVSGEFIAQTTTTFTKGAWQHAAAVYTSPTLRAAYLNGGGKGTNTASSTPTGLAQTNIGAFHTAGSVFGPFAGQVAEVAVWNVALTDAEVAQLAGLGPDSLVDLPLRIRRDGLVAYWKLLGVTSPEFDYSGKGRHITPANGPRAWAQPDFLVPQPEPAWSLAAGAAGATPVQGSASPSAASTLSAAGLLSLQAAAAPAATATVAAAGRLSLAGAATPTSAATLAAIGRAAPASVIFADAFAGTPGASLVNRAPAPAPDAASETWQAAPGGFGDGNLVIAAGGVGATSSGAGSNWSARNPLTGWGGDGTLKFTWTNGNTSAVPTFYLRADSGFHNLLEVTGQYGTNRVQVASVVADSYAVLASAAATLATGTSYTLELDLAGTSLSAARLNGTPLPALAGLTIPAAAGSYLYVRQQLGAANDITFSLAEVDATALLGAASLASVATVTASGQAPRLGSASLSATATATAAGIARAQGTAALIAAATVAASGQVSLLATASASAVASLAASGQVSLLGSASASASSTLAAAGSISLAGAAALSAASSLAASGRVDLLGAASLASVATVTASGQVGSALSGSATLASSATATAAGRVALLGSAAPAASATLAASGQVSLLGSSALASASTISAAGQVGAAVSGAATLASVATLSASGIASNQGAAVLIGAATLSAAGRVSLQGSAALGSVATASAAGQLGSGVSGAAALASSCTLAAAGRLSLAGSAALAGSSTLAAAGSVAGPLFGAAVLTCQATATARVSIPWVASTLDPDLVTYLTDAIGQQVWAPLKRGLRYRSPLNVPDDPVVSYARVVAVRPPRLSGPGGTPLATYQIDVHGSLFDEVLVVSERVRYALDGFRGRWGDSEILGVLLKDQVYGWLENEDPKKVGVYRIVNEVAIHYRESVRAFA